MTARCEDFVYPRGMRVAGGFPCPYPGKYLKRDPGGRVRRFCGVHLRAEARRSGDVTKWRLEGVFVNEADAISVADIVEKERGCRTIVLDVGREAVEVYVDD